MTARWYVLCCRVCDELAGWEPTPIPFETPEDRGRWASAHTKGTGHDSWIVTDEPREQSDGQKGAAESAAESVVALRAIKVLIESLPGDEWMEAEQANSMLWQTLDAIDAIVLRGLPNDNGSQEGRTDG